VTTEQSHISFVNNGKA